MKRLCQRCRRVKPHTRVCSVIWNGYAICVECETAALLINAKLRREEQDS